MTFYQCHKVKKLSVEILYPNFTMRAGVADIANIFGLSKKSSILNCLGFRYIKSVERKPHRLRSDKFRILRFLEGLKLFITSNLSESMAVLAKTRIM